MHPPAALTLIVALLGQAAPLAGGASDDPAARLAVMKTVLAAYDVHSEDTPPAAYRFQADPVLRFTNTVGSTRDGAVFLWLGAHSRPMVAVQASLRRDGLWFFELSSLSERPLIAESPQEAPWAPARAGAEFKPVPGARPAETPEQRLRQVRALAAEFSAEDHFRRQDWQKLRMLSKPFARYGEPGTDVIDGVLFGYVLTTDPEVLLMIEARRGAAGAEWQFAFAPMTTYPVKGSWKGQEVWSLPYRGSMDIAGDPTQPFHVRRSTSAP